MTASVAASLALRPLLAGSTRPLPRTLAVRHAVHFGPLALVDGSAVRLPHACVTADPDLLAVLAAVDGVVVGAGRICVDGLGLAVGRWFDPRPRLAATTPDALAAALAATRARPLPAAVPRPLPAAVPALRLLDCDRMPLPHTAEHRVHLPDPVPSPWRLARQLLGRGPGLTPTGDDVLAGMTAAVGLLPEALGAAPPCWWPAYATWLRAEAPRRTGDLSARLLVHATRGEVMRPVADLLHALTGRGDPARCAARLAAIGHTSGAALLHGIAIGATLTLSTAPASRGVAA